MKSLSIIAGLLTVAVIPAGATSLLVLNPSFESPACSTLGACAGGTFSNDVVTDWTGTGGSFGFGVYEPGGTVNSVPNGVQVAYLNTPSTLLQDVEMNGSNSTDGPGATNGGTIAANTTYTLNVFVGERNDLALPATYGIELIDGQNSAIVFASNSSCTPTAGNFVSCTASFDSAVEPTSVGDDLGVELFTTGTSGQAEFDEVSLAYVSDSVVPEPGTIGLALLGLGALAGMWRRAAKPSLTHQEPLHK